MRRFWVGLIAGLVFAIGLGIGGMTDANNVTGFLNVAGDWDYRLALVMGGGLLITTPGYRIYRKINRALLGGSCTVPTGGTVDKKLLLGGAIFGLGWGLGGFCPGPAVVSSVTGEPEVLTFLAFMVGGMVGHDRLAVYLAKRAAERAEAERIFEDFEKEMHDDECIRPIDGATA